MLAPRPAPAYEHRRFEITAGEGEPALFDHRIELRRVIADGFRGELTGFGTAWLMEITSAPNSGLLVAITSRSYASIEDQMTRWNGSATVVVHRIDAHGESASAAGMAGLHELPHAERSPR